MENLGLNNDVSVGGRKFHVQTNYSRAQGKILCNAFQDGQVIDSKEVIIGEDVPIEEISKTMNQSHQEMITELEILYYIAEKVKTVRHAPSANKLGLLFLKKNLIEEAVGQFKIALEIDPSFFEVYANLGKAFLCTNSCDQAIAVLKKGAIQAPNYADIHNYLGIAYIKKKNYKDAIGHLEEALKHNSNYPEAHYNLGLSLLANTLNHQNQQDPEVDMNRKKAVEHFQRAAQNMENNHNNDLKNAMRLIQQGDFSEAVNLLEQKIPNGSLTQDFDYENEFYLKFMYGGKGKDDSFIADYVQKLKEVINKNPNYADLRNHLGIAYLIQCRNLFLKSLEEFRAALKINSDFRKAEKNLKLAENDGKGFLILLRALLK
jgi:superkiller protein 3